MTATRRVRENLAERLFNRFREQTSMEADLANGSTDLRQRVCRTRY
ncbi:MAG: hypothetical protein R3C45_22090 [Phycisphaerales bacterium]